jgi:hypothetical protein
VLFLRAADDDENIYSMAYDIGTTTIVGYLLNAKTGEQAAVVSMLNPQAQFGADVIQRADYAITNGLMPLQTRCAEQWPRSWNKRQGKRALKHGKSPSPARWAIPACTTCCLALHPKAWCTRLTARHCATAGAAA